MQTGQKDSICLKSQRTATQRLIDFAENFNKKLNLTRQIHQLLHAINQADILNGRQDYSKQKQEKINLKQATISEIQNIRSDESVDPIEIPIKGQTNTNSQRQVILIEQQTGQDYQKMIQKGQIDSKTNEKSQQLDIQTIIYTNAQNESSKNLTNNQNDVLQKQNSNFQPVKHSQMLEIERPGQQNQPFNKQIEAFQQLLEGIDSVKLQEMQLISDRNDTAHQHKEQIARHEEIIACNYIENQIDQPQLGADFKKNLTEQETLNLIEQQLQKKSASKNNLQKGYQKTSQEVQDFCQGFKKQYNHKVFNQKSVQGLTQLLEQIYANNSYVNSQESFQKLKIGFFKNKSLSQNKKQSKSIRKSQIDSQFNLQLTIKSKLSKNSINLDRQDSLIYSNATSFGLQSTQNKDGRKINRQNSISKLRDNHQFDLIQIDKTSSKGEVQNSQRQFSVYSVSDTQRALKYPPKNSHSNRSNRNTSSQKRINSDTEILTSDQENKRKKKTNQKQSLENQNQLIMEKHEYQIVQSYIQNKSCQEGMNLQKQRNNQDENKQMQSRPVQLKQGPQIKFKKSFSIKSYNSKLTNSQIKVKKSNDVSVFSSEILNLQGRITQIKEAKILKKKMLEQQLLKVNRQIDNLNIQENFADKPPNYNPTQNTIESRIIINDNLQQKHKAIKLVKNLRAEKLSRQNTKRRQVKVIDKDIHKQIQDIMRLKYFNEERVKQKKKLEIIQRMKQQQIRKIVEQKQKKQSSQFLAKLKHNAFEDDITQQRTKERTKERTQERTQERKVIKTTEASKEITETPKRTTEASKKTTESPKKTTETPKKTTETPQHDIVKRQVRQPYTNPALEKRKNYLNRIRNFTILKKRNQDVYQQILD